LTSGLPIPPGYYLQWSGQYEYIQRANARLRIVVPVTQSLMVMVSLPFPLVGGVWLMWLLDYNMSNAVGMGFIALAGVAVEIGVVMLVCLDEAFHRRAIHGEALTPADLFEAVKAPAGAYVR